MQVQTCCAINTVYTPLYNLSWSLLSTFQDKIHKSFACEHKQQGTFVFVCGHVCAQTSIHPPFKGCNFAFDHYNPAHISRTFVFKKEEEEEEEEEQKQLKKKNVYGDGNHYLRLCSSWCLLLS
jgi:hypothetical protein